MSAFFYYWQGSFVSRRNDCIYTVTIAQHNPQSGAGILVDPPLSFPADEPLVIERKAQELYDPIEGSSATLRIISPYDRAYTHFYSTTPGAYILRVSRTEIIHTSQGYQPSGASSLFWTGTLDPEFYEESYAKDSGYVVSLTFSDFGILSRLPFDLSAVQSVASIISGALSSARLDASFDTSLISTSCGDQSVIRALTVLSEAFTDSEGDPLSYADVLTGVLQPLGLRLRQHRGRCYIYDLNALYAARQDARLISWAADDQIISATPVKSAVSIRLDTKATADILADEIEYLLSTPDYLQHIARYDSNGTSSGLGEFPGPSGDSSADADDFQSFATLVTGPYEDKTYTADNLEAIDRLHSNIFFSRSAAKGVTKGRQFRFFKIQPIYGGQETCGVALFAWPFKNDLQSVITNHPSWLDSEIPVTSSVVPGDESDTDPYLMRATSTPLAAISGDEAAYFCLVLKLSMLLDVRYISGETADDNNDHDAYCDRHATETGASQTYNVVEIPVEVRLLDANGNVTHHLARSFAGRTSGGTTVRNSITRFVCHWEEGDIAAADRQANKAAIGLDYLEYKSDLHDSSPVFNWAVNVDASVSADWCPALSMLAGDSGNSQRYTISSLHKADGLRIPYPPAGGSIRIDVLPAVRIWQVTSNGNTWTALRPVARYVLFKAPTIRVARYGLASDTDISTDSVTTAAVLNPDAKEELTIDILAGTAPDPMPTGQTLFRLASSGLPVREVSRAGVTDRPEQLLIRSIRAHYTSRRDCLDGTVFIDPDDTSLALLRDASANPATVFLQTSAVEDLRTGTAHCTFQQINSEAAS